MNYDRVLLELLDRIQTLEEEVSALKLQVGEKAAFSTETESRCTTADIKRYIEEQIADAARQQQVSVVLRASDIHRNLKLKSRFPMVCNAMRQCMKPGDEVLHETPSGYSSSLKILYHCGD